jgi:hypothetical protein
MPNSPDIPTAPASGSDLSSALDATPFVGLAVTFCHTGFNASIEFRDGEWSPHTFGTTASEAILKCLGKWAPVPVLLPPPPY